MFDGMRKERERGTTQKLKFSIAKNNVLLEIFCLNIGGHMALCSGRLRLLVSFLVYRYLPKYPSPGVVLIPKPHPFICHFFDEKINHFHIPIEGYCIYFLSYLNNPLKDLNESAFRWV